jgi:hypothetical protein
VAVHLVQPASLLPARPYYRFYYGGRGQQCLHLFSRGAGGRARETLDLVSALVYLGDFS